MKKGNAKVFNLEEDLQLRPGIYNTALSIFFVGYVIGKDSNTPSLSLQYNAIASSLIMLFSIS